MRLIFVHGRSQQKKDPGVLKEEWKDALLYGVARADKALPPETEIEFPYYGDRLDGLLRQLEVPLGAEVAPRGPTPDTSDSAFRGEVIEDIASSLGLTDADFQRELDVPTEKGPGNWAWVQAILQAMDRIPGVNSWAIDQFTRDVYAYLTVPAVRGAVDEIVSEVIGTAPSVVVAHSLGSVVAYNVLRQLGSTSVCPRFITVGSPLGIRAIKRHLESPLKVPESVHHWFNAFDDRDVVSLVPLDASNFPVSPPIENKSDVMNFTDNRHGITGYLSDPVVALRVVEYL